MCVKGLTCDFGDFDDDMVVSLTRLTLSSVENASKLFFSVAYLECVSGGRKLYRCCCVMLWLSCIVDISCLLTYIYRS